MGQRCRRFSVFVAVPERRRSTLPSRDPSRRGPDRSNRLAAGSRGGSRKCRLIVGSAVGAVVSVSLSAGYPVTALAAPGVPRVLEGCSILANPTVSEHTRCPHASLSGADLTGTDLREADLTGSTLVDADLSGANLDGANLTGADLTGTDLIGAKVDSVVWNHTRCPDGSVSDLVGGTCVDDLIVLVGAAIGPHLLSGSRSDAIGGLAPPPLRPPLPLTGLPLARLLVTALLMTTTGGLMVAFAGRGLRSRRRG